MFIIPNSPIFRVVEALLFTHEKDMFREREAGRQRPIVDDTPHARCVIRTVSVGRD